jgi:hypothetical protein
MRLLVLLQAEEKQQRQAKARLTKKQQFSDAKDGFRHSSFTHAGLGTSELFPPPPSSNFHPSFNTVKGFRTNSSWSLVWSACLPFVTLLSPAS